jgi:hypothetical protein
MFFTSLGVSIVGLGLTILGFLSMWGGYEKLYYS